MVENPPATAEDAGDADSIPGRVDAVELEMATYSGILS